jgi:hypothetical protein
MIALLALRLKRGIGPPIGRPAEFMGIRWHAPHAIRYLHRDVFRV